MNLVDLFGTALATATAGGPLTRLTGFLADRPGDGTLAGAGRELPGDGLPGVARHWRCVILVLLSLLPSATGAPLVTLRTQTAVFELDARGSLGAISRTDDTRDYLAPGQPAPLLSLRIAGQWYAPEGATWDAPSHRLTLQYPGANAVAVVTAEARPTHVVFAVADVRPTNRVELVLWGPYPTTLGATIGETVGVVRDRGFAIGLQALNAKTLGGYPTRENDIEADYTAEDHGDYPDLPPELKQDQLFRGDTARRTEFGSVLQAYCRNRDHDRVIANWGHDRYLAPAFPDGGVIGSKIALFACPAARALDTIGAIEVAEGLPHPLLDGVWGKVSPAANRAYLIVDFSERTIDRAIEMTRRAGLKYLYHSSPFETWGHFRLKPDLFPHGWDGFRACAEKARQAGIRLGFHTLSNFITPNDPYVTPRPDPRLARIGASELTADLDATGKDIAIAAPDYFRKATAMNTVVIGEELIRYAAVSAEAPWRLLECRRGAWDTKPSAHARGETVARLMDHDYKVFLTDADLSQEVARRIAALCNDTGARQLSFDGLEGNWSTGMGQYGRTLFTQAWYDALTPELRGCVINDASNPGHFNWHIYTRMNWGEPWYAGFRESQTLYRFKNQLYFERNLMPRMLGWFALRPETSLEDAEWLLARAAGFDAGFALAASLASTAQLAADPASADAAIRFGATPAILQAINRWETARMAGAFPPPVQAALRDNAREFHLVSVGTNRWDLQEVHVQRWVHPAENPAATGFPFQNLDAAQPLQWTVGCAAKQPIAGLTVEIDGRPIVALRDQTVPPGGSLKYVGGSEAAICDSAWKELARVPVDPGAARVQTGPARITVGCAPQNGASLKVELRTVGAVTRLEDTSPATGQATR